MSNEKDRADLLAPISLTTKREHIPVTISDGDGKETEYYLQEMDGTQRDSYISLMSKKVSVGVDGKVSGVRDFSGLQSQLIIRSLVHKETGKFVEEKLVNSWRASLQNILFERASRLNGLDKDAEDDAKND